MDKHKVYHPTANWLYLLQLMALKLSLSEPGILQTYGESQSASIALAAIYSVASYDENRYRLYSCILENI